MSGDGGFSALTTVAASCATSLAVAAYLLHRLRSLEDELANQRSSFESTSAQQRSVLQWLSQRLESIDAEVRTVGRAAPPSALTSGAGTVTPPLVASSRGLKSASSKGSSPAPSLQRAPSWESMVSEAGGGYRTAEEDVDDAPDGPPPARAPPGFGAGPEPEPEAPAAPDSPAQPVAAWGAQSMVGSSAGWACVGELSTSGSVEGLPPPDHLAPTPLPPAGAANSLVAVLEEADALYEGRAYEEAAALLTEAPTSGEVLWRLCRLCKELADVAKARGAKDECERLLYEGLRHVSAALEADPSSFAAHKWYAIAVSQTSAFEGTKATIQKSFVVKQHFLNATELNPRDATSRHLLGIWFYEVAGLSWTMRKLAAAIFASPPSGSYDEALAHFTLAESLSPGFYLRNRLMIGKAHLALRDKKSAKEWVLQALEVEVRNADDEAAAAEARALLTSL